MELGVNDHHKAVVVNYLRFARYQRSQRLRAVDSCFKELEDSRLVDDDTFTRDEVQEMMDGLLAVVRGEVESELINTAHTNVLLLRQIFIEAEKWHLKLTADISELENRELLEQIADFEEQEFRGATRDSEFNAAAMKLQPLNETGGSALLHMEIQRLQDENQKLRQALDLIEKEAMKLAGSNSSKVAANLARLKGDLGVHNDDGLDNIDRLEDQIAKYKLEMEQSGTLSKDSLVLFEKEIASLKHEMLRVRHMLELKEEELDKKVSNTVPFKNLKSMLMKKNEQLKDLRRRMSKYETDDD